MNSERLPSACLDQLRALSGCVVASAIETFGTRLRNTGFTDSRLHCIFDDLPPIVGYAVTARIRTSAPPMEGRSYYDGGRMVGFRAENSTAAGCGNRRPG